MVKQVLEFWKTLQAAAGIKWQLLGVFVFFILLRADWISRMLVQYEILEYETEGMIFGFPSWILGFLAAVSFLFIWFATYAHKLRLKIQVSRVRLSELRKTGVDLRNKGQRRFHYNPDWESWRDETIEWQKEVYNSIKEISVADAEWFDTMDVVPDPRLNLVNPVNGDTHPKRYREHDFQVARLGEMIRDLWGK